MTGRKREASPLPLLGGIPRQSAEGCDGRLQLIGQVQSGIRRGYENRRGSWLVFLNHDPPCLVPDVQTLHEQLGERRLKTTAISQRFEQFHFLGLRAEGLAIDKKFRAGKKHAGSEIEGYTVFKGQFAKGR